MREGTLARRAPGEPVSALDRFRLWTESLPVPAAAVYLALWAMALAYMFLVPLALDVRPLLGWQILIATLPVYFLAANHLIADAARGALLKFRPLLAESDERIAEIERTLTTLPLRESRRLVVIGAAFVAALSAVVWSTTPDEVFAILGVDRWRYVLVAALPSLVIVVLLLPFAYRTLRLLRTVTALHEAATGLDPLRPGPVGAFSELTLRVAIAYMLVPLLSYAIASELLAFSISFVPIVVFSVAGAAIFVVPLLGLHARLDDIRAAEMDKVTIAIERIADELTRRGRELDLAEIDPLITPYASLMATREMLQKAQTWPWRPGTFNLFVSLFGAPIVLFVLTRFLGRLL